MDKFPLWLGMALSWAFCYIGVTVFLLAYFADSTIGFSIAWITYVIGSLAIIIPMYFILKSKK